MPGNLQPLDEKFQIVDANGKPTSYFTRWAQQRQIDIVDAIGVQYLADHPLQAGSGITLTPDGNLANSPTIDAEVQAILDQITTIQGSVLYRGAVDWVDLAPGTAGYVLSTNGAGANPSWVAQSGGGGGLGPAWTPLTFGSSSSAYGQTVYTAAETFTLAVGQRIELECYIYKVIDTDAGAWIGNLTNGHNARFQLDNNNVLYRRSGGVDTPIGAPGANTFRDWTGMQSLRFVLDCSAASSNFLRAVYSDIPQLQTSASTAFTTVDTHSISLQTGDISKCYARARVVG